MNLLHISAAFLGGMILGAVHFFLLWWTVRLFQSARRPWLLAVLSFWARLGIAAAGFYFLMGGRLENLAAGLAGFLVIRQLSIRLNQRREAASPIR
jgi:F1F0 ATPase subunit 2